VKEKKKTRKETERPVSKPARPQKAMQRFNKKSLGPRARGRRGERGGKSSWEGKFRRKERSEIMSSRSRRKSLRQKIKGSAVSRGITS